MLRFGWPCCIEEDDREACRHHRGVEQQLKRLKKSYTDTNRLLLLGAGESGKSTIMRQMILLHVEGGFTDDERRGKICQIRTNVRTVIETVTSAMKTIDPPIPLGNPDNEKHLEYVEDQASRTNFEITPEYFERVEILWKDAGVQAAYERSNEYQLIDCASYFMAVNKIREVARPSYMPSNQDILHCRVQTRSIVDTKFRWDGVDFHVFDVGGQRGERRKWIHCFNNVTAIIFVVASSSYNLCLQEDETKNRLVEALELFEQIWRNRWLKKTSVILFLNKQDILLKKCCDERFKLEYYFPEFAGFRIHDNSRTLSLDTLDHVYTRAKHYIQSLFSRITHFNPYEGKKAYFYFTTAVDTNNINRVFVACRKIIIDEHLRFAALL